MHTLLVEDSNTLAKLFQVQLQLLGHTVTLARDQATALAAFKSEVFDLIFLDMGLEGIHDGGLQLLREIKALAPQQRVGMLSSNDLRDMVRLSQQGGAEFYMVKPYTPEALAAVLSGDKEAMRGYTSAIDEGRVIVF